MKCFNLLNLFSTEYYLNLASRYSECHYWNSKLTKHLYLPHKCHRKSIATVYSQLVSAINFCSAFVYVTVAVRRIQVDILFFLFTKIVIQLYHAIPIVKPEAAYLQNYNNNLNTFSYLSWCLFIQVKFHYQSGRFSSICH